MTTCSKPAITVKTIMRKNNRYTVGVRVVPEPEVGNRLAQLYDVLLSDAQPDMPGMIGDMSGEEAEPSELQEINEIQV